MRGRDVHKAAQRNFERVSIHAPVRGRDTSTSSLRRSTTGFNPRARAWARPYRRAHCAWMDYSFNPRARAWARPGFQVVDVTQHLVSIHAPVRGRDQQGYTSGTRAHSFNPRARAWARPAPGDNGSAAIIRFNPRARAWARPVAVRLIVHVCRFQSTRPCVGATQLASIRASDAKFQSTRPCVGATESNNQPLVFHRFQSTRPCVGATCIVHRAHNCQEVSIHAPVRGRDQLTHLVIRQVTVSIHAPVRGRDCLQRLRRS